MAPTVIVEDSLATILVDVVAVVVVITITTTMLTTTEICRIDSNMTGMEDHKTTTVNNNSNSNRTSLHNHSINNRSISNKVASLVFL